MNCRHLRCRYTPLPAHPRIGLSRTSTAGLIIGTVVCVPLSSLVCRRQNFAQEGETPVKATDGHPSDGPRPRVPAVAARIMTNDGKRTIALRASAGLFVLMVGCGAAVAARPTAATPDTPATSASSSEMPLPPEDPGGLTGGGALPVVPARLAPLPDPGGCIIGLNCGCIRGLTCPGTIPHHHPAPTNGQPQDGPPPPAP